MNFRGESPHAGRWTITSDDIKSPAAHIAPDGRTHELREHPETDSVVNAVHRDVRAACLSAADHPPDVFTLTVPTDGRKTLAAMTFPLEHALRHGLERVAIAIPYTSIIEQTAQIHRDVFRPDAATEHHGALSRSGRRPAIDSPARTGTPRSS